jgi:hypothetical protein
LRLAIEAKREVIARAPKSLAVEKPGDPYDRLSEAVRSLAAHAGVFDGTKDVLTEKDNQALWEETIDEYRRAISPFVREGMRDHPAVDEWAAAERFFGDFRRQKNKDLGDMKEPVHDKGAFVSSWIEQEAAPLLERGLGPEKVRRKLRRIAEKIVGRRIDERTGKPIPGSNDPLTDLRNQLLRALQTRQGFHKRLVALGLI